MRRSIGLTCAMFVAVLTQAHAEPATRPAVPAAERVARIVALERAYRVADPVGQFGAEPTVRGRVVTSDGKPLPAGATLTLYNFRRKGLVTTLVPVDAGGTFEQKQSAAIAIACLVAQADGYATAIAPRLIAEGDGTWPAVELTLAPAVDVAVRVVDEEGKPVAGARLDAWALSPDPVVPAEARLRKDAVTTDADGRAVIAAPAEATLRLRASADAHQSTTRVESVTAASRAVTLTILKSLTTSGRIVDQATREPVAGATLTVLRRRDAGGGTRLWTPDVPAADGEELATTIAADANGEFATDRLGDDATHDLLVRAPGRGCELLRDVRGGDGDLVVALGSPRPVTIVVTAPDVAPADRPREVSMQQTPALLYTEWPRPQSVPIAWDGDVGRIELPDPVPGRMALGVSGMTPTLRIDAVTGATQRTWTLAPTGDAPRAAAGGPAIAPAAAAGPTRELIYEVVTPDGVTPDAGSFALYVWSRNGISDLSRVRVRAGEARFAIVPPKSTRVSDARIPGYWAPLDPQGLELAPGDGPARAQLLVHPAGAIVARVKNADGTPADARIVVALEPDAPHPMGSDGPRPQREYDGGGRGPDGRYLYTAVPMGRAYRVIASRDGQVAVSPPVAPDDAAPIAEIELTLPEGAPLDVIVRDPDGRPATFRPVRLLAAVRASKRSRVIIANAVTDREGRARFAHVDSAATALTLEVPSDGDARIETLADVDPARGPVTVRLRGGSVARGRVIDDETGGPIRDAVVSLAVPGSTTGSMATTIADGDGRFVFRGLDAATYKVDVADTHYAGTVVTRDARGEAQMTRFPDNPQEPTIVAGSGGEAEIRRVRIVAPPR